MSGVGIVGAGIAGLSLALALQRAGIEDVNVYDAQPAPAERDQQPPSQLLSITPNATRVLRALGLRDLLEQQAEQPNAVQQRVGSNGFLMSELPLAALAADRFGAPFYNIGYEELLKLLRDAVAAAGVTVHYTYICVGRHEDGFAFSDTQVREHALLVGADGIDSVLRASLPQSEDPEQAPVKGHYWHAQVPLTAVPESLHINNITLWLGPSQYLGHSISNQHQLLYLNAATEQSLSNADPAQLRNCFSHWQPQLAALTNHSTADRVGTLRQYHAPNVLSMDNFALIGDAAHPMTPHLDQAAATALEDAWVLSRFIDQHEHNAAMACAEYQRYRLKRVRLLVARSYAEGQQRMAAPGMGRAMRALKSSLTSRFLPELAMQRLDWIYRYDCIRGFA